MLDQFDLIVTQNRQITQVMRDMGADETRLQTGIDLTPFVSPLTVDELELARLRGQIGDRPIWVAASTHKGEEETLLAAHAKMRQRLPDALMILAPHTPDRGGEVAQLIAMGQLTAARRSQGETPRRDTHVVLADTLGERGLWYGLSPIVFLGGSLRGAGASNPFEVAQAGGAILAGGQVNQFVETYESLTRIGAARVTNSSDDIAAAVLDYLEHPKALAQASDASARFVKAHKDRLDEVTDLLMETLHLTNTPD